MNKDIIIKKSKIHGKGVFANRNFKKGGVVIDYSSCSEKLTREQMEKTPQEKKKFISQIDDNTWILFKSPGKYVNHSCNPNTESRNNADIAIKDIKKGEEITANYVKEKVPGLKIICNCGEKNCVKIINNQ